ncbi:MAG: DUF485 domain-containing protein [Propioniciclava sp.]|uniref:DUF485 domain-containing protein n=1 Tax=Propioniciclava sp. TaxID=2038686 RepID=UPI0039E6CFE7
MSHNPDLRPPEGWTDETEFHLPDDHWPLPELVHTEKPHQAPSTAAFLAVAQTPEYTNLRSGFRRFAFPMTVAGLVSYFTYVLLSIYAVGFMSTPAIGAINVGTLLGLAQFAVTYLWTAAYVRFANAKLDPTAHALKARLEQGATS